MQQCITIFIPTYNRAQLLKRAIESALNQKWENLEVIVSDNGSSDETFRVAEEYLKKDCRFKYFRHPQNRGMIANYEFGLSIIQSEYFSLLSDDDLLLPSYCETAMQAFSENPSIAFFAGSTLIIDEEKKVISVPLDKWKREGIYLPPEGAFEMVGKFPVPTSVMFKKSKIFTTQIDPQNPFYWDCDFLMRIASQYPIAASKKPCAIFYSHPEGYSFSLNPKSMQMLARQAQKYHFLTPLERTSLSRAIRHYFYYPFLSRALLACVKKNPSQAMQNFAHVEALRVFPIKTAALKWILKLPLSPLWRLLYAIRRIRRAKKLHSSQEYVQRFLK
jgi:glycosyltransferase involved in cell wall biosynthesis